MKLNFRNPIPENRRIENFMLQVIGIVLSVVSAASFVCFAPFIITDNVAIPMVAISLLTFAVSAGIWMFTIPVKKIHPSAGIVTIAIAGLVVIAYMSIPYLLSDFTLINAAFETISGFTTTGLSTIRDYSSIDSSLLLWRAMTGWLGGIAFIILFTLMMPSFGLAGRYLFSTQSLTSSDSYKSRINRVALGFLKVYALLTAVLAILLMIFGNGIIDSICIAMSTISTTGFAVSNTELINFNLISKLVIALGMVLSSINFITAYRAIILRSFRPFKEDSELKQLLIWIACITVVIFLVLLRMDFEFDSFGTFADTLFTVASIGSTTGYIFGNIAWPSGVLLLFIIVAMIGGSSNSATGGMKISRLIIILNTIYINVVKYAFPNRVLTIKYNTHEINTNIVSSSILTMLIFTLTIGIGAAVFMVLGVDTDSALAFSVSSITTVGTGLFSLGDTAVVTSSVKIIMCFLMWLGRMEIFLALILLTPSLWKDYFGSSIERFRRKAHDMRLESGLLRDFRGRHR